MKGLLRWSGRRLAMDAAVAMVVGAVAIVTAVPAPAGAAVTAASTCNASVAEIYTPPSGPVTQAPGTVLKCRKANARTIALRPTTAWQVQYVTTDLRGERIATSGVLILPYTLFGPGSSKIVAHASASVGLGSQCAASKQFIAGGFVDDLDLLPVSEYLRDGHAVAIADGVGYLDGQTHTYVIGPNNGHAQLDMARAATRIPGVGLNRSAKVVLNGYSEGGHTTLWAARLARTYAPELPIVGAALGAAPVDMRATANSLNGSLYAGFLANSVLGLKTAYPDMPFDELLNDAGRAAIAKISTSCLASTILSQAFERIENFTNDRLSLDQLFELRGTSGRSWGEITDEGSLYGVGPVGSGAEFEIGIPLFDYWGRQDDVIPPATQQAGLDLLCRSGVNVRSKTYLGIHATVPVVANKDVRAFMKDRFNGVRASSTC